MNDDKTVERFEAWGLLELFGHQRLAGKLSDQTIGGVHFLRIDVPAVGDVPPYTRFFTQGAIYGMTVLTEDVARRLAAGLRARPVHAYELLDPAPVLPAPPAVESDGPENPGADLAGAECGGNCKGAVPVHGKQSNVADIPFFDRATLDAAVAEAAANERKLWQADAERLDWLATRLFTHRWNGVVGSGWAMEWGVAPDHRHTVHHMRDTESGDMTGNFRAAIDAAIRCT